MCVNYEFVNKIYIQKYSSWKMVVLICNDKSISDNMVNTIAVNKRNNKRGRKYKAICVRVLRPANLQQKRVNVPSIRTLLQRFCSILTTKTPGQSEGCKSLCLTQLYPLEGGSESTFNSSLRSLRTIQPCSPKN